VGRAQQEPHWVQHMKVENAFLNKLGATPRRMQLRQSSIARRGQAAVEFALVATVAMIVLFVAVQLALIGEDALALGQMNYQGARWAAVYTCASDVQIASYIVSVGSPSVSKSGGVTCGSLVTMSITDTKAPGSTIATRTGIIGTCSSPPPAGPATTCSDFRVFGSPVTINLSFDARHAIFLGNGTKWMGLINIPTTLKSSQTAMAE
jgi:hypothetical protein